MTDYINSHNMITGTSYGPSSERLNWLPTLDTI